MMKKRVYWGLLFCLALSAFILLLTACDQGQQSTSPIETTSNQIETAAPPQAHEHAFGEWQIITQPTCTSSGSQERICDCGEKQIEQIAPLAHTEVVDAAVAPSCTEGGLTEGTHCGVCGQVLFMQTYVEPLGHQGVTSEATEPTCLEDGWTGETFCQVCFTVLVPGETIPATGHDYSYSETYVEPTCTKPGYITGTCRCGEGTIQETDAPTGHMFGDWYVHSEATCTRSGILHRDCLHCDHTEKQIVEATGHTYNDVVTPPTCTDSGYTIHTCHCGDRYVDDYQDKLDHDYSTVTIIPPGCGMPGYTTYTCDCGHSYADSYVDPLGHDYEIVIQKPTCTALGYTTRTCRRCQDSSTYDYTDPIPHQLGEIYYVTVPTCTSAGLSCQDCSMCSYQSSRYVQPLGHDLSETIVEATCTEQGYTLYTCVRCDATSRDRYTDARGHAYVKETLAATCTAQGYVKFTCQWCQDNYFESITEPYGHLYESIATRPTCIEQGYTTHTCIRCEDTYIDSYTDTVGHTFENRIEGATCTQGGYIVHTCSYCGYSYNGEPTEPKGHRFWIWETVENASCTQNGLQSRYCMDCKMTEERVIEATGHDYADSVMAPTCTADGYTTHSCGKCGHTYTDNYITAFGHTYTEWIVEKAVTCTENGYQARQCTVCGNSERNILYATGHDYRAVVSAPTCIEQGYTTYTCEACGNTYIDDYIDCIPHAWGEWQIENEPTCTDSGSNVRYCEGCNGKETSEIASPGHAYTQMTVTSPTCSDAGYTTHTCSRCGDSYTDQETAALGHDYQAEIKAPTCTEYGYTKYTCSRCYTAYETDQTMPTDHISEDIPPVEPTFTTNGQTGGRRCASCGMQLEAPTIIGKYMHIYVEYDEAVLTVDAPDKASFGTYITITATPKQGYEFEGWYIGEVLMCTTPEYTFRVGIDEYTYTAKVKNENVWDGTIGDGFAGGSGTQADPYLISDGWQLAYLAYQINSKDAAYYNNKYYALTADIDLGGVNWDPIGCIYNSSGSADTSKAFIGHFDGRGYTVYNLTINASKYNFYRFFGLFGVIEAGGYVENVRISNCHISIDGDVKGLACCGGIAGRIVDATVANCSVDGSVHASTSSSGVRVGGIVGMTFSGSVIADCSAEVTVSGFSSDNNAMAGGIAGNIEGTTVARCFANATVSVSGTGSVYAVSGGVVGYAHTSSSIYDCHSTGSVSGSNRRVECRVGGIVGAISKATVTRCYTTCSVFSKSEKNAIAGGIVGHMLQSSSANRITQCLSLASVSADNYGGWYKYTGSIYGYKADGSLSGNQSSKTDTVEFYTSTLGWSSDVWDFSVVESGELPTLKH